MPISCSQSVLTGQEGLIQFKPAGTSACLKDNSDFPAGTSIEVGSDHDFYVGDAVTFAETGGAALDSALTVGTTYYVVAKTIDSIEVSATAGGTPITLAGDGGTGTTDTPAPAHIELTIAEFQTVCQVQSFEVSIEREELDVTSLPCSIGGGSKYAAFRSTQAGYASGSGTITVLLTADQTSLANRLMSNTMLRSQAGAEVKLYVSAVSDGLGDVDDAASIYIESEISITGMSTSANPDDPITAELTFNLLRPKNVFGAQLV